MGINKANTLNFIKYVLEETTANIVIDADAIRNLSDIDFLGRAILTPNEREFIRLTGIKEVSQDLAKEFALNHNCVVVLKEHNSFITDGKQDYINCTGNARLAKGGSGDILSGIICGLVAIGVSLFDASSLGSYILGRAAELVTVNEYSAMPKDIIYKIPAVIEELLNI